MTGPLRIFAINLGSTSTKVAYYEDEQCIHRDTIDHDSADLRRFTSVFDQGDLRKEVVLAYLGTKGIELSQLDAFVSRGGQTQPIPGGVYRITPEMVSQAEGGDFGVHVCSVGCRIALDLTRDVRAIPLTVDTPSTDEFQQLARISGLKGIERRSCFQALNQQAMARFYARSIGRDYQELNLVVAMLGGGISVVAHRQGVMIDGPDALEGEGPFSNNRSGTLPPGALVRLCFTDSPDMDSMLRTINGESGLVSYLGTTDIRAIEARIGAGEDQDVAAGGTQGGALVDGGADAVERLVAAHHRLARRVAAAFRRQLILDHHRRAAGLGKAMQGAADVHRVAIAGIAIGNQRDRDGVGDVAGLIDHLAIAHQPQIGRADPAGRGGKARHEGQIIAFLRDQLGRERIETAGHDMAFVLHQQGLQGLSGQHRHHHLNGI